MARIIAQLLSLGWFLLAARLLDREQFGQIGIALVVVAVTSALAEFGVNRTLIRHLAHGGANRSTVRRAVLVRCTGAALAGPIVVATALAIDVDAPWSLLVVAAALSWMSGVTDLHLAALRAMGSVRVEAAVLVGERLIFLVAASAVLAGGGGPTALLVTYLVTNALSATIAIRAVAARSFVPGSTPGTPSPPAAPMLDAEGRRTAMLGAVSMLVPRVGAVSIAVSGTAFVVGGMSLAQRPVDAMLVLGATALTVVHPEARRRLAAGDRHGERTLVATAGWSMVAIGLAGSLAAWLVAEPALRFISGSGSYADMAGPLVALLAIAAVSLGRHAAEISALAEARAGDAAAAGVGALVSGAAAAVILVPAHGVAGAIAAQAVAELTGLVVLVWCATIDHTPAPTVPAAPGDPGRQWSTSGAAT